MPQQENLGKTTNGWPCVRSIAPLPASAIASFTLLSMSSWVHTLYAVAAFSTIFCASVNCYTWQIAYPLWRSLGPQAFPRLHADYMSRLTWVITVPHIVMFFSTFLLIVFPLTPPHRASAILLFVLVDLVIAVSAFVAGPVHDRFLRNQARDEPGMTLILRISALRVGLMLLASAIILAMPYYQL